MVVVVYYVGDYYLKEATLVVERNNRAVSHYAHKESAAAEDLLQSCLGDVRIFPCSQQRLLTPPSIDEHSTTSNRSSLLDEGMESVDTANIMIELKSTTENNQIFEARNLNVLLKPAPSCPSCPSTTAQVSRTQESSALMVQTIVLFNLAQTKQLRNKIEEAIFFYQQALEQMILADESNVSWIIRHVGIPSLVALARFCAREDKWNLAASYLEIALTHTMTLHSQGGDESNNATNDSIKQYLGMILNALGVIHYHSSSTSTENLMHENSALFFLSEALPVLMASYGPKSKAVATTLNNLGRVFLQRRDFVMATSCLERAVEIRLAILDPASLDTAVSMANLGCGRHQMGDSTKAIEVLDQCLEHLSMQVRFYHPEGTLICELGESNRSLSFSQLTFYINTLSLVVLLLMEMAKVYQELKHYPQAGLLYHRCLGLVQSEYGERHAHTADILHQMGKLYFDRQLYDQALETFQANLRILRTIHESCHPHVILTMYMVSEIHRKQQKFDLAVKIYKQALDLQKVHHGEDSIPIAAALHNLGTLHDENGEPHLALQCLQRSVMIRESIRGQEHLDLVESIAEIGSLLFRQGMVHNGLEAHTEAWRISALHLGPDHPNVGKALLQVGEGHMLQGNYTIAISCWNETLRIQGLVEQDDSHAPDVSLLLRKIGEAHRLEGNLDQALALFQQAMACEQNRSNVNCIVVAKTLKEIGSILLAQGKVDELMESFVQVAHTLQQPQMREENIDDPQLIRLITIPLQQTHHLNAPLAASAA
jgi:tetratricopeptide (TPR) repeat protein